MSAAVKSCLVVDDSRVIRMVARRILEQLGFAIARAELGTHPAERDEEGKTP